MDWMEDILFDTWHAWQWSGSHDKPSLLLAAFEEMGESGGLFPQCIALEEPEVFRVALTEAYCRRNVAMGCDLTARQWVRMFRAYGYISDGPPEPSGSLTVYRGCMIGRHKQPSWTTDLDTVAWFARGQRVGRVFQADVEPQHILARFDAMDEHEVVVSPFTPPIRGWLPTMPISAVEIEERADRHSAIIQAANSALMTRQ